MENPKPTHNPRDVARIINESKDAVDRSCFGPMFVYPDPQNIMKKDVNQLAWMVFTIVLQSNLRNVKEDNA